MIRKKIRGREERGLRKEDKKKGEKKRQGDKKEGRKVGEKLEKEEV